MSKLFNGVEREAKMRLREQLAALPDVEPSTMPLVDIREAIPVDQPEPLPLPTAPKPKPTRRRRSLRLLLRLGLLGVVAILGMLAYQWYGIERVDLSGVLATSDATSTNILLVGTDSRAGLATTTEDDVYGLGIGGERTDTLLILNVSENGNRVLSIPRDLYISSPADGRQMRINALHAQGPEQLVAAIIETLGVPIHHYAAVDFASFLDIVDAIGSVPINLDYPAYDVRSGFRSDRAGTIELGAVESLAFVRSRSFTEVIDGVPTTDGTGDFGRTERQRTYLQALLDELFAVRNPVIGVKVGAALRNSLAIDNATSIIDAVRLTLELRNVGAAGAATPSTLPVTPATIDGASVLLLDRNQAETVLADFRSQAADS